MPRKTKRIVWHDKAGKPTTFWRIMSHEQSIHGSILKAFPERACYAGSMNSEDLVQECFLEVARSLAEFDPELALRGLTRDESRKTRSDAEHLAEKLAHPEHTIREAEGRWVRKRLYNYLRRVRWENSVPAKGGQTVSIEAILVKAHRTLQLDGEERNLFDVEDDLINQIDQENGIYLSPEVECGELTPFSLDLAERDRQEILDLMEREGEGAATQFINLLAQHDTERYESVKALCVLRGTKIAPQYEAGELEEALATQAEPHQATPESQESPRVFAVSERGE